MTFRGEFPIYTTLNEIPKTVLMPPETHYFLASVILYSGDHYKGLSLDVKNSHGIHISYDGMYGEEKRIQVIRLEDPIQNSIRGFCIYELWYVKTIPPTVGTITTKLREIVLQRSKL